MKLTTLWRLWRSARKAQADAEVRTCKAVVRGRVVCTQIHKQVAARVGPPDESTSALLQSVSHG